MSPVSTSLQSKETGWHRHGHDYVIPALTDCGLCLDEPGGGLRKVMVPVGLACRRSEGVEHGVVNRGAAAMSFVEVEPKERLRASSLGERATPRSDVPSGVAPRGQAQGMIRVYLTPLRVAPAISPCWPNTNAITGSSSVVCLPIEAPCSGVA